MSSSNLARETGPKTGLDKTQIVTLLTEYRTRSASWCGQQSPRRLAEVIQMPRRTQLAPEARAALLRQVRRVRAARRAAERAERIEIYEACSAGLTQAEVAEVYAVEPRTVGRWLTEGERYAAEEAARLAADEPSASTAS